MTALNPPPPIDSDERRTATARNTTTATCVATAPPAKGTPPILAVSGNSHPDIPLERHPAT